jgi:ParB family chromosome partitioning protein
MSKPALGRGLGALLGGSATKAPAPVDPAPTPDAPTPPVNAVQRVPLTALKPCTFQPRKEFAEDALRELADSIREQGIVQPLIARRQGAHFEIIAGERRWRAAQLAGLTHAPVVVREADDREVLELALIENLQRENLNAMEEAQGFSQLIDQFALTQEQAAARVGKSRVAVANALRLLKLTPDVQAFVRDARLSVGHAKAILGLENPDEQRLAADRIIRKSLNVRQAEELVSQWQKVTTEATHSGKAASTGLADPNVQHLHSRLQERLGTKVHLRYRKGKGILQIHFFNDNDLERVLDLLGVRPD